MKTIYFGIGLMCLLGDLGCNPAKKPKLQLSKEIGVYNKEVREKHLERTLDSVLWSVYAARIAETTKVEHEDVLGVKKVVVIPFYECELDTTIKIRIIRNETYRCNVFYMDFNHVYLFERHINDLYLLLYKGCHWDRHRFCLEVVVSVHDTGMVANVPKMDCMWLWGYRINEDRVCEYFENPEVVRRMTPWLRREGVRRGYLSTDNW